MKKVFALCLMSLLTACGGPSEAEPQGEKSSLGTVESALPQCGTTCPGGYHSTSYYCSASCGSSFCPAYNGVNCDANTGASFSTCDSGCPSGYHIASYAYAASCEPSPNTSGPNKTVAVCQTNSGASFSTCGIGCPSGYRAVGYGRTNACNIARNSLPVADNMTNCAL
ncbi:MAG: hypothetical protein ABW123_30010 [Cystobacter sp.]